MFMRKGMPSQANLVHHARFKHMLIMLRIPVDSDPFRHDEGGIDVQIQVTDQLSDSNLPEEIILQILRSRLFAIWQHCNVSTADSVG